MSDRAHPQMKIHCCFPIVRHMWLCRYRGKWSLCPAALFVQISYNSETRVAFGSETPTVAVLKALGKPV
jgi:hypothetical protein